MLIGCTEPSEQIKPNLEALRSRPAGITLSDADLPLTQGRVVIQGGWGNAPGQFGKRDEASRPGPMSLAVSQKGEILILDQVNRRVQRFDSGGNLLGQIAIASEATEDIAMASDGSWLWALVSEPDGFRLERYSVSGTSPSSSSSYPLSRSIQLATGVFVTGSDVWIEQRHELQTRVVSSGQVLPPDVQRHDVLGRPDRSAAGLRLSAARTGRRRARVLRVAPGDTTWPLFDVTTPLPLLAIQELASDRGGRVFLGLLLGQPELDGSLSRVRRVMVVVDGSKARAVELAVEMATDAFRPLAVSPDGAVHQLQTTEEGVTVRRWRLR
jgi:hypothetical protein